MKRQVVHQVRRLVLTAVLGVSLTPVLVSTGCTVNRVEGTVASKTQRAKSECVEYSKYRTAGRHKCTKYGNVLHSYIVVAKDGDFTNTVEVEVTIDVYDHTIIGSHYTQSNK